MQNSGVTLEAKALHFASAKDKHPVYCKMQYYGVIEEICELHYHDFSDPLFGCKWVDNNTGVSIDDLGFTVVNLNKIGHKEDPFIFSSQDKQVFYVTNPSDNRMYVVLSPRFRHIINDHKGDIVMEEESLVRKV